MALVCSLKNDPKLAAQIDGRIVDGARYVVRNWGNEVSELIAHTIENCDSEDTSRKIDLQIDRDLQFVRINAWVIGAFAGFTIDLVSVLVASLCWLVQPVLRMLAAIPAIVIRSALFSSGWSCSAASAARHRSSSSICSRCSGSV